MKETIENVAAPAVNPDEYDETYFLTNCGGYQDFAESGGQRLPWRLSRPLELANIQPGQTILDFGCGRGELVVHAADRSASVVGLDYSRSALNIAAKTISWLQPEKQQRISFVQAAAGFDYFAPNSFDCIFMTDVVEHLSPVELDNALSYARKWLKPNGRLIIHTFPNRLFYEVGYKWTWATLRLYDLARKLYKRDVTPLTQSKTWQYPRHEYELKMHINEQDFYKLRRSLQRAGFNFKLWLEDEPLPADFQYNWKLRLFVGLTRLEPLSKIAPLNRLFASHIWTVATK